ncbi:hypothetical protein AVEN_164268-1 [Araneus ventricosus]|uniref:Reverse transcriptase domain-containing protein n=1 Tax=Araneus ventricosus TaxID=182803 RepID=A0A4Y2VJQ2_ARAVE|nr:hypothetical protein AVEN_164268-1 [Araneus ventricosus]
MKKRVGTFSRRAQREPTEIRQAACIIYSRGRAQYRRHLVKTRRRAWRKFCMEASNPFGKQYEAIFCAGRPPSDLFQQSTPAGTELSFAQNLLETLYPHTPQAPFIDSTASSQPNDSPFSRTELLKVIRELNKTKAPGYDGLDNIILQQIHSAGPELLLEMFNKSLSLDLFPMSFKTGVILLFYKEGEDQFGFKEGVSIDHALDSLLTTIVTKEIKCMSP